MITEESAGFPTINSRQRKNSAVILADIIEEPTVEKTKVTELVNVEGRAIVDEDSLNVEEDKTKKQERVEGRTFGGTQQLFDTFRSIFSLLPTRDNVAQTAANTDKKDSTDDVKQATQTNNNFFAGLDSFSLSDYLPGGLR